MDSESKAKFAELQQQLTLARKADRESNKADAIKHYIRSAQCLHFIYQRETIPERKEKFKSQLNKIIFRAEELKGVKPKPPTQKKTVQPVVVPKPQPKPQPVVVPKPQPVVDPAVIIEKQELVKLSVMCEKNALTMDQNGDMDGASKKYVEAIKNLLKASKLETNQAKKNNMETRITKMLIRAEELKKLLSVRIKPAKPQKVKSRRSKSICQMRTDSYQQAVGCQKKATEFFKSEQYELANKYFNDAVELYQEASKYDKDPLTKSKLIENSRALATFVSMNVSPKLREELGKDVKDMRWFKIKVASAIEFSRDGIEKEKNGNFQEALESLQVSYDHFRILIIDSPPSIVNQSKKMMFAARCKILEEKIKVLKEKVGIVDNPSPPQPSNTLGFTIPKHDPSTSNNDMRNTSQLQNALSNVKPPSIAPKHDFDDPPNTNFKKFPPPTDFLSGEEPTHPTFTSKMDSLPPPPNDLDSFDNLQQRHHQGTPDMNNQPHHHQPPPTELHHHQPPPTELHHHQQPQPQPQPHQPPLFEQPPTQPPTQQTTTTTNSFDFFSSIGGGGGGGGYNPPPVKTNDNPPPVSSEIDFLGGLGNVSGDSGFAENIPSTDAGSLLNNKPPPQTEQPPTSNDLDPLLGLFIPTSEPSWGDDDDDKGVKEEEKEKKKPDDNEDSGPGIHFDGDFGPSHNIILNFQTEKPNLRHVSHRPWEDNNKEEELTLNFENNLDPITGEDLTDTSSSKIKSRLSLEDVKKEKRELFGGQEIFDVLGQGSVGTVYRGTFSMASLGTMPVAIKEIQLGGGGGGEEEEEEDEGPFKNTILSDDVIEREVREAMKASSHPNVLRIMGWTVEERIVLGKNAKIVGIVTEYLDGGSLFETIEKWKREDQQSENDDDDENDKKRNIQKRWILKWNIAKGIVSGLNAVHEGGFIHGENCSSQNILLSATGEQVKICDFGMGRIIEAAKNRAEEVCTPKPSPALYSKRFVAPETLSFGYGGVYTRISDAFSVGVIIYHLSTQKLPYDHLSGELEILEALQNGEKLRIPGDTPKTFKNIIILCTQQKPENRPSLTQLQKYMEEKENDFLSEIYGL